MEIVSTMTFELTPQLNQSSDNNDNIKTASSGFGVTPKTVGSNDENVELTVKTDDESDAAAPQRHQHHNHHHESNNTKSRKALSPKKAKGTSSTSTPSTKRSNAGGDPGSVYHTPAAFSSPALANLELDLSKVKSALTELNSAVKEEEDHFFLQLEAAESRNLKLRQNLVSNDDLREANEALTTSLEEAQALINTMRAEAETQVEALSESLMSRDSELSRIQEDFQELTESLDDKNKEIETLKKLNQSLAAREEQLSKQQKDLRDKIAAKDAELEKVRADRDAEIAKLQKKHKSSLDDRDETLSKLQRDYKDSLGAKDTELKHARLETKQALVTKDAELNSLKLEFESLRLEYEAIRAEKEDIEQGHEEAKEKWKRLVITMKSEYDNFRASFDHLKASKKEMEENHKAEKESLEKEAGKLRTANGSLTATLDSLKICKEVADNEYLEAKKCWELQKETLLQETDALNSEIECLRASRKQADEKIVALQNQFDERIRENFVQSQQVLSSLENEHVSLKSEINSLRLAREVAEQEKDEMKVVHESLQKEINSLLCFKGKYEELTSSHESKVSECNALKAEIEAMENAKEDMENTFAAMQNEYEERTNEFNTVKGELFELIKEKETTEEKMAALEAKCDALSKELEDLEAALAKLEEEKAAEIEALKSNLATLESEKVDAENSHKAAVEEMEQKVAALQAEYDSLVNNFESLNQSLEEMKTFHSEEKDKLEKKIAKLNKNVETKSEALSMALTKFLKEQKAKDRAENDTKTVKAELEQKVEEEKACRASLEQLQEKYATDIEEFSKKLEEAVMKYAHDMEQALKDHKGELEATETKYRTMLEETESKYRTMREVTDMNHRSMLEETQRRYSTEIEEKEKQFASELAAAHKELEDKEKKFAAELEGAEKRVLALDDLLKYKDEEHKKALLKLNEKMEEGLRYEAEKREAALTAQVESENKVVEMEKLVAKTKAEILAAKCQGDSLKECIEQAEAGKEEALAKCATLNQSLKETTSTLEKTTAERDRLQVSLTDVQAAKMEVEKKMEEETECLKKQINILNKSVAKKIATITSLESRCQSLQNSLELNSTTGNEAAQKLDYLHQLISGKEKELELIKCRCDSLQSSLNQSEEELEKKAELEKELQAAKAKIAEVTILVEKKNTELQTIHQRCDKLQASLKKAETLYLEGVETIKNETEKKQRAALEEAQDRAYVLNQLLAQKEQELDSFKETCEKLKASGGHEESAEAAAKRAEEHKALTKQIRFLDEMVAGKDKELQLIKARCDSLQLSLEKMQEAHEKQVALLKEATDRNHIEEIAEASRKLQELNMEIAQKQSKLKSLQAGDQGEFEIILENGEDEMHLKDEMDALRARCAELEAALKSAQKNAVAPSFDEAPDHLKSRFEDLEAALAKMTLLYEDECERRKEAEQVFLTIKENPSDEVVKVSRHVFGRNRPAPEFSDTTTFKKSSRWLSLRGRRKKDDMSIRTYHPRDLEHRDEYETISRTSSPSKWRSQYSPRRRMHDFGSASCSGVIVGDSNNPEAVISQIPAHIRSNFLEVGFYKQRLQNNYLPVLCLGPNDVPPGPIRDEWLAKFNKSSKVLSLGVYFFGKDGQDEDAYGTIPWFSFVPYSKAVNRGLNQVPREIADKIDAGLELTPEERQIYDGLQQVNEAAQKTKEERTHPLQDLATDVPKCIVTDSSSVDDHISEMGG